MPKKLKLKIPPAKPELVCLAADAIEGMKTLPPGSVDLVITSPPYALKGDRYEGGRKKWDLIPWVEWMTKVVVESCRISRNAVVIIANGSVRDGLYYPACEGLIWECYKYGIACERPCIWHKNAPPNRKDWFGNDWEFCMAFRPPNSTRYFNGAAIGTAPKYGAGGDFRQRDSKGKRRKGGTYPTNPVTRPRDVLLVEPISDLRRATVGGGHMAPTKALSDLASENEAPFPERLVEPFLQTLVPPGGAVCDPFVGGGTVLAVAQRLGLSAIGFDCRRSQIDLTNRRLTISEEQGDA